ncbi:MAG: hypothetical protein DRN30_03235, partial [Thermoplasmata archaeon]
LFNKGDEIWIVDGLKLKHGKVEKVCGEGHDTLYRVDREIYITSAYPYRNIIRSDVAYTEETALAKLVERYDDAIGDIIDHLITLGNDKRGLKTQLKKMREKNNERG